VPQSIRTAWFQVIVKRRSFQLTGKMNRRPAPNSATTPSGRLTWIVFARADPEPAKSASTPGSTQSATVRPNARSTLRSPTVRGPRAARSVVMYSRDPEITLTSGGSAHRM
jgi:hypothetical protein